MKDKIFIALTAIGCFLLGTIMPRSPKVEREEIIVYKDTSYSRIDIGNVTKLDVPQVSGVPSVLYVPETKIQTVYKDSIRYVVLDREHKVLENNDAKIWYSGVNPTIDSLIVKRQTVIQKEPWKRHSISLEAETGYFGEFGLTVGAAYQYDLFKRMSVSGKAGYDLYLKQPYVAVGLNLTLHSW